ncbi:hypothetical protein ACE2AJ_08555 [Aquihabitans daechungensis]|uniref:NADH-quinone oxidoreductase subunit D-related protein n=1 Tax=Aquihabitans daechungensis TaxID=1052257 RepID=UPI003B9EDDEF
MRRDGDARRGQRDLPGPDPRHRRHPRRCGAGVRHVRCQPARQRRRLGPPSRRPVGLAWNECDWNVITHPDGDSFARFWVRLQEIRESTKIVDQLLDGLPSGPIMAKVPRIIKVPEGEAWVATENPLGEMGYYVVSKGGLGPFRVKIRTASFNNIAVIPWVTRGVYVPDVVTILASLYFILGDIDR